MRKSTSKENNKNKSNGLKPQKEAYINEQGFYHSTRDNTRIFFQRWLPEGKSRMLIRDAKKLKEFDRRGKSKNQIGRLLVIQHGFGEHSDRYHFLLETLQGSNTTVYALDARGHGRSEGKRGHVEQFQYYIDDLTDLIQIAKREQQVDKVYLLGHSLGGVIASQYALQFENQKGLEALILSSPAFRVHMNFSQQVKKIMAYILAGIAPATTIDANLDIQLLSHDQDVVAAYAKDPLVHGKISFQMGKNLFLLGKALIKKARVLNIPCFIFTGDADSIVNHEGAKDFYENTLSKDKNLQVYPDLYHETMNELPERRKEVLTNLKNWLLEH